jgi:hypothetical protein
MRRFDLKLAAISLSICAVIALIVSRFSRLPFVAVFLIVVGAMLLNGLIATYEDDMPGGFNNPDGKLISPFIATVNRVISWIPLGAAVVLMVCGLIWARSLFIGGIALGVVAAIVAWTVAVKFRS